VPCCAFSNVLWLFHVRSKHVICVLFFPLNEFGWTVPASLPQKFPFFFISPFRFPEPCCARPHLRLSRFSFCFLQFGPLLVSFHPCLRRTYRTTSPFLSFGLTVGFCDASFLFEDSEILPLHVCCLPLCSRQPVCVETFHVLLSVIVFNAPPFPPANKLHGVSRIFAAPFLLYCYHLVALALLLRMRTPSKLAFPLRLRFSFLTSLN